MPLSWQHGERAKEQLERCEGVHANYREYKKVQAHTVFITWLGRGGGGHVPVSTLHLPHTPGQVMAA